MLRAISRTLGLGKARYFIGKDLQNNSYYELPNAFGDPDPRHTRRMVEYANNKEAGDHVTIDQKLIPVQWMLWLRHTRADAPSIPELEQDVQRIATTRHNASVLAFRDAQQRQQKLLAQQADHEAALSRNRIAPGEERAPVPDVWQASKARVNAQVEQQQQQAAAASTSSAPDPNVAEAVERRAGRRRAIDAEEAERQRARHEMDRSPLSFFDVEMLQPEQPPVRAATLDPATRRGATPHAQGPRPTTATEERAGAGRAHQR